MSWFGGSANEGGGVPLLPTTDSAFSRLISDLAQDNVVKYGDEIRLFVRSNYLKKPKPAWLVAAGGGAPHEDTEEDVSDLGWTLTEQKGGFVGVYTKPDGTPRVMVPPVGNQAQGRFVESYFRIEPAQEGLVNNSVGRNVAFGDKIVLIDGDGLVWNNKTGGLFGDGYLQPRPRGVPGEAYVSFAKNGKNAFDPVQYGELGVYIDVVDSHRYRAGFNRRLTNFKGNFSSTAGGYVSSDGSGDALMFVVDRYRGKIRNRRGVVLTDVLLEEPPTAAYAQDQDSKPAPASLASVSIITHGTVDVQQVRPKFGKAVFLYGLSSASSASDSQVEIKLDDGRTVMIDGEEMLGGVGVGKHVEPGVLEATWQLLPMLPEDESSTPRPAAAAAPTSSSSRRRMVVALVSSLVKLAVVYAAVFAVLVLLVEHAHLQHEHEEQEDLSRRTLKRISLGSIVLCWLLGLTAPLAVLPAPGPSAASRAAVTPATAAYDNAAPPIALTIRSLQPASSSTTTPLPATPRPQQQQPQSATTPPSAASSSTPVRLVRATSASPGSPADAYGSTILAQQASDKWAALDNAGMPTHFAFARFLNGERGNREVALKRWEITGEWRRQFGVDLMLQRSHKLFFLIKKHYPTYLYGRTKFGNPIYIEQVGKINTKKIREAGGKLKDMMYHYVYTSEFMWSMLEPAEYGSSLTILDVAGIGLFDFAGENMEFIKKATAVVQEHYPERGFMIFVINAPRWFTGIWAVVSSWVNPVTLKKIRICGTNYQDELFKFVDRDALPICYGGTNPTALEDSQEERLFRNVAARALVAHNDLAVGPDGNVMRPDELKQMIDSTVDHLAYKSQMQKVSSVDGQLLCDERGRPVERF